MGKKIVSSGKWRKSKTGWILGIYLVWLIVGLSLPAFGQIDLPGMSAGGNDGPNSSQAGHVKVQLVSQYEAVAPAQQFAIAVVLEVDKGWHLYANPKQGEFGLDTEVIPQASSYFRFGKVIYPPGEKYVDKQLNAGNHIYEGKTTIYVPVEVKPFETTVWPESAKVQFQLKGLTCGVGGTCLPWDDEASIQIKLAPEQTNAKPNRPELFADFDVSKVDWQGGAISPAVGSEETKQGNQAGAEEAMPDYQPREWNKQSSSVWLIILAAIGAGILLNVMPCVLPVIPLKVLSLIQQSQADVESGDRFKAVKLSLVFSAGILIVFIGLAIVMSVFKILYGQQFQSDAFKFVMLMIIFVLGLSMLGLFEIVLPGKVTNVQIVREGYLGALGMGVLATLLATPCSAPLLGPVLAWSLSKPTAITVLVFIVVGIGMSAPYVVLTAFPKLLQKIPKAGNWMIRLKEGLGFVMLGVAAYLIFLFPAKWQLPLIIFCLLMALAAWLGMRVVNYASSTKRKVWARGVALVILALGIGYVHQAVKETKASEYEEYSLAKLIEYNQQGQNVMVEFTADWCPNCKYVELTVLSRDKFKKQLAKTNTILMIADWTHKDPAITELLNELGSKSIPFTAVFPGKDSMHPIVLRDIYTLDTVLDVLDSLK